MGKVTKKKGVQISDNVNSVNSTYSEEPLNTINYKYKNEKQKRFSKLISDFEITICVGPAGTGKTYIACAESLKLLLSGKIDKIIIIKSVTTLDGEDIGYLKGSVGEKVSPYINSFSDNFLKLMKKGQYEYLCKAEKIEFLPLAFIRGRSIDKAMIIIDEAQNISFKNMRSIMTRLGENSKMIIMGDTIQIDMKKREQSSLALISEMFLDEPEFGIMEFSREDVVRNPLIIKIEDKFDEFVSKGKL